MKILMVSSFLPYPLTSGGHVRLYNIIKHISEKHDVTLICEKRDFQTEEDIKEVEKVCKKVITVRRKKQWSLDNILKTGLSKNSFLITGHTTEELRQAIKDEMVRELYDLIHVETFYVLQNLPQRVPMPVVLVEHNIEHAVYKRYADLANPLLRPFLFLDILKLKKQEEAAWKRVDKLVAVSNAEKRLMKKADISVIANGVDTTNFKFRSFQQIPKEKRILFIGDFKWFQNRDIAENILKKIWPQIDSKLEKSKEKSNVKLWIVGRNIPQNIKNLATAKNIIVDEGSKEKTEDIFRKAYVLLSPIRKGGGTSYKIIEAMATGVGVVTTSLGVEGLEAKPNVHVLTSEHEDEMADLVLDFINDHTLYKRLTINSRKLIEENYDWKIIAKKLDEVYMSCL